MAPYEPHELSVTRIGGPVLITAAIGILCVLGFVAKVNSAPDASEKAMKISRAIAVGARTFLKWELSCLSIVVAALFILICTAINWRTGICYLFGALTSATCGVIGMMIATKANAKVCHQSIILLVFTT